MLVFPAFPVRVTIQGKLGVSVGLYQSTRLCGDAVVESGREIVEKVNPKRDGVCIEELESGGVTPACAQRLEGHVPRMVIPSIPRVTTKMRIGLAGVRVNTPGFTGGYLPSPTRPDHLSARLYSMYCEHAGRRVASIGQRGFSKARAAQEGLCHSNSIGDSLQPDHPRGRLEGRRTVDSRALKQALQNVLTIIAGGVRQSYLPPCQRACSAPCLR
jgi:hypothetical protein